MLGKITDGHPLKDILGAMVDDGDDAANAMKERLAGWFDEALLHGSDNSRKPPLPVIQAMRFV